MQAQVLMSDTIRLSIVKTRSLRRGEAEGKCRFLAALNIPRTRVPHWPLAVQSDWNPPPAAAPGATLVPKRQRRAVN